MQPAWPRARTPERPLVPSSTLLPATSATKRTKLAERWLSRLSTTKCHSVAVGSVAIVRRTCSTKSASVRVGPLEGAKTCPLATSKLMKNEQVPWRMYSNSRRVTRPDRGGRSGASRSSACTCVNSSVLTVRWPASALDSSVAPPQVEARQPGVGRRRPQPMGSGPTPPNADATSRTRHEHARWLTSFSPIS